jgi:Fe-S cluster assembly protein SufD
MSSIATRAKLSPALEAWQAALISQPSSDEQQAAFQRLLEIGLPTPRIDSWKYTDLRRLATKQFHPPSPSASHGLDEVAAQLLPIATSHRIVFIDGVLVGETNSQPNTSTTVSTQTTFELLNTALAKQTSSIVLDANTEFEQPIYIAYVWTQAASSLMALPRINVQLKQHSKATLIEQHIGLSSSENFTNSMLMINVGEHAALEHIRIQDDAVGNFNIANIQVNVQRGGHYSNHHFVLGAALARTDLCIKLTGIDAAAELHGLILAQNTQHLDVHTSVEHQAPNTRSSEDYRGIADQRGRVVFRGKVIVAKDAQKTDAKQSSRNLLLSEHAEIDTRPELEIYANDVKCAHGATVGQLDSTALFYLQSRGIDAAEARALLTHAFATEVIERIPDALVRDHVLSRLMTRMRSLDTST